MNSIIENLAISNEKKIILIILDGLGGLPDSNGLTELEEAITPNMDRIAVDYECGLSIPVEIGITPGSGPGHLGVFGYEPLQYPIGRGVLEALGINIEVGNNTVTARCNFCTIEDNVIKDRRAGRISSEENIRLVALLNDSIKHIEDYPIEFHTVKEHRFVFVIRDFSKAADVSDTDPQITDAEPLNAQPLNKESVLCSDIINKAAVMIGKVLESEQKANYALFRGISKLPEIPTMRDRFKLKAACIAAYPMYKGLSKLVGMDIIDSGESIEDQIDVLKNIYEKYDYFFFHVKKTDSYGEDGNRKAKIEVIERFDSLFPSIESMGFDVIAVTGDHSTPAIMKAHSFHAVPLIIKSPYARKNPVISFSETECLKGAIGTIKAKHLISLMLAGSDKLKKFGA